MNKIPLDDMELEVMEALTSMKTDQEIGMPDIDQELVRLQNRKPLRRLMPLRRVAAILVTGLLLSGLGYAAIRTSMFTRSWNEPAEPVAEAPATEMQHPATVVPEIRTMGDSIVLFRDVRLDSIMPMVDQHYGVESCFDADSTRAIRLLLKWDKRLPLDDVLRLLNGFERFQIQRYENSLHVSQPVTD